MVLNKTKKFTVDEEEGEKGQTFEPLKVEEESREKGTQNPRRDHMHTSRNF